jgi:hypothetical protein
MRPEEVRTGAKVRVADGHRSPHLLGLLGAIEQIYRTSERTAMHVRLDDGRWQLLWPQELEQLGKDSQTDGAAGS